MTSPTLRQIGLEVIWTLRHSALLKRCHDRSPFIAYVAYCGIIVKLQRWMISQSWTIGCEGLDVKVSCLTKDNAAETFYIKMLMLRLLKLYHRIPKQRIREDRPLGTVEYAWQRDIAPAARPIALSFPFATGSYSKESMSYT